MKLKYFLSNTYYYLSYTGSVRKPHLELCAGLLTGVATGTLCPGLHSVGGPTLLEASLNSVGGPILLGPMHSVTNYSPSSYIDACSIYKKFIVQSKTDTSLYTTQVARFLTTMHDVMLLSVITILAITIGTYTRL